MSLRIGFAYNLRPTAEPGEMAGEEEPPSRPLPLRARDRYAEWDEPATVDAVAHALSKAGTVIRLEADSEFPRKLVEADPDIVFNIAEGLHGASREAQVPAICEFFGIPYSASDPVTLGLALDKRRAKEVFRARGIPTAAWTVLGDGPDPATVGPEGPWIVKPLREGSSMGIGASSLCHVWSDVETRARQVADDYAQPALVERFLPGREFTLGVLGNGHNARALPPIEIRFDALPAGAAAIYGYEAKWVWDSPDRPLEMFTCPARVDAALADALARTTLAAYHALGCRDWARIDLRLDAAGVPHVIEVNPLPGILPDPAQNSCLPKAARAAGIDYDALILGVLGVALERCGIAR